MSSDTFIVTNQLFEDISAEFLIGDLARIARDIGIERVNEGVVIRYVCYFLSHVLIN